MIEKVKDDVAAILQPSTNFLVRIRVTPDVLTMIGFLLNLVAATLFGIDEYRWAGLMVLVAGVFDLLDGQSGKYIGKDKKGTRSWEIIYLFPK